MILFPDAVTLTTSYLRTTLPAALAGFPDLSRTDVVVSSQVPNPRPPVLVRVQAVGGQARDVAHERSLMAVQCWHEGGEVQATDLARVVVAILRSWPADPVHGRLVTTATATTPYSFPDPDTRTPRFQTTLEVVCRPERNKA